MAILSLRADDERVAESGDAFDAVFIYAWMQDIKFSPDGLEIAAISTHPIPRLIVCGMFRKLLFERTADRAETCVLGT